jgi:hypothetical protein
MTVLRLIYAALLVVGTILPWSYFYAWFDENGWSLSAMIDAWYVNDATSGLVYDLTIAALALTVWALWEGLVRRDRWFLAVIPATYAIGVSAGLPLCAARPRPPPMTRASRHSGPPSSRPILR